MEKDSLKKVLPAIMLYTYLNHPQWAPPTVAPNILDYARGLKKGKGNKRHEKRSRKKVPA